MPLQFLSRPRHPSHLSVRCRGSSPRIVCARALARCPGLHASFLQGPTSRSLFVCGDSRAGGGDRVLFPIRGALEAGPIPAHLVRTPTSSVTLHGTHSLARGAGLASNPHSHMRPMLARRAQSQGQPGLKAQGRCCTPGSEDRPDVPVSHVWQRLRVAAALPGRGQGLAGSVGVAAVRLHRLCCEGPLLGLRLSRCLRNSPFTLDTTVCVGHLAEISGVAPLKTVPSYWAKGIWGDWFPVSSEEQDPIHNVNRDLGFVRSPAVGASEALDARGVMDALSMRFTSSNGWKKIQRKTFHDT